MIVTVDAVKVAGILADNDEMLVEGKPTKIYREMIRESEEWKERYEYYFKIITNEAEIK